MTILITGGAGYIGSHTVLTLLEQGYAIAALDNLCNASIESLHRVQHITGKALTFYQGDIQDKVLLQQIFKQETIDSVIHFAGLKAVGESVQKPLEYYRNNVYGTLVLLEAMQAAEVRNIVFSSSATVYGEDAPVPYVETMPRGKTTNPYGTSKAMVEQILTDLSLADKRWNISLLRYFNPIGAHESGLIGEDPQGIPNNLLPFVTQVAIGKLEYLSIFGNDYPTPDGTCIRDYIHVVDLAEAHLRALEHLKNGLEIYNLGTGRGTSVLELVNTFEKVIRQKLSYQITNRREGDIAATWADASKAQRKLNWVAKRDLNAMLKDAWRWQSNNPNGYSI